MLSEQSRAFVNELIDNYRKTDGKDTTLEKVLFLLQDLGHYVSMSQNLDYELLDVSIEYEAFGSFSKRV